MEGGSPLVALPGFEGGVSVGFVDDEEIGVRLFMEKPYVPEVDAVGLDLLFGALSLGGQVRPPGVDESGAREEGGRLGGQSTAGLSSHEGPFGTLWVHP